MKTPGSFIKKQDPLVWALALFSIVIHLLFTCNLEYHRDELLYFSLGQHPDFGFATVPPMIGWIAWIMQKIFGYSVFAVRLCPAFMSGLNVLIVADMARELGGKRFASLLAGAGMIISIFGLRTFSLFQPVHLDLLFWTLTFYLVIKYINSGDPRYFIWFGIMAGLSLLNKYLIGLLFLLYDRRQKKFRFLGIVVIAVVLVLMLMKGKSYYTQGIFPFLISAGAVFYGLVLKRWYTRSLFMVVLLSWTITIVPFGLAVYKTPGLVDYFDKLESKYGFDFGRNFEDGTKHSLPQDYADMLGWEELTKIAARAWGMISDKMAAFIYCENYGQAGAITIIGKKYGLPEAISFNESFRYWFPSEFDPDITAAIYINNDLGEDIGLVFNRITKVGSITNPDAREFGTAVYLCEEPAGSFNSFWKERTEQLH